MESFKEQSLIMGKRLKSLRESKGLSHVSLSEQIYGKYGIDISRDSLMNYEVSDEYHTKAFKNEGMRIEYLRCLADYYGVSTDYLLGLTETETPNMDIRAVSEYTGLADEIIEFLHDGYIRALSNDFIPYRGMPISHLLISSLFNSITWLFLENKIIQLFNYRDKIDSLDYSTIGGIEEMAEVMKRVEEDSHGFFCVQNISKTISDNYDETVNYFKTIIDEITGCQETIKNADEKWQGWLRNARRPKRKNEGDISGKH